MSTNYRNKVKSKSYAVCAAVALLCAASTGARAQSEPESTFDSPSHAWADKESAHRLNGVWRMTRTPINCQSGQPVAPSFQAIMTFNDDGTLTGYAVPPSSSPALGSPEYGLWRAERGAGNYSFTDLSYSYDIGGVFAGSVELTAKVQLGGRGNTLMHQTRVDFFDVNGAFLFSACGLATGTRFR